MKRGNNKWEDLAARLRSIVLKLEQRKEGNMKSIRDKGIGTIYKKCKKKEKGKILDFLERYIKYNRGYIGWKLRQASNGVNSSIEMKKARVRRKKYGEEIKKVLIKLWQISDYLCGKRLAPFLPLLINQLEKFKEINLEADVKEKLLNISPATIDRMLKEEKRRWKIKSKAKTKPGTLLKKQIPIRTYSEWDDKRVGFMEMDLVGHDGGNVKGEFGWTLNLTDILTGWTDFEAIKNRAQVWSFNALKNIEKRLPFPLKGIDSDNDSSFINEQLIRYCKERQITFTRSRPSRKNDNCYVEQKNWSAIRRVAGYLRYDTEEALKVLNELYGYYRLYVNYFQPVMKLKEKIRDGSKITKRYDKAKTPYERLLECNEISEEKKKELKDICEGINPAELMRQIEKLQDKLIRLASKKSKRFEKEKNFEYNLCEATI